jgi:NitT/TauT family transport system substrate-binding protein
MRAILMLLLAIGLVLPCDVARSETGEVRIAQQYGMIYLPLHVAIERKLIEKHAAAAGLPELKVSLLQTGSGAAMNDALLSGNIDIATGGTSVLLIIADKTRGRDNIRGMMALCDSPILFNTSDPRIRTIRDFTEADRIAVTAVKVTHHAIVLQMAAAQEFGWENRFKLDPLTVSMAHPDAMAAILAERHEIRTHAATIPYFFQELEDKRVHTVINSYDVAGGRHTVAAVYNAERWKKENPNAYAAVAAGLAEAMALIEANKKEAAEIYVRAEKSKQSSEQIEAMLRQEDKVFYTPTPSRIMVHAEFMHRVGTLKTKPESWRDFFWENVHDRSGS